MTTRAHGKFVVKLNPLETSDTTEGSPLARMSIDKEFQGDLVGTSKGEMLSAGSPVNGSAVYVAIERVTGTIGGRSGTFVLYHTATMNRGAPQLAIRVAPDSGTDELAGITGSLNIVVVDGLHFYDFDYEITSQPAP